MSMGIGIAIGITLVVWTQMTPIIKGDFHILISTQGGQLTLIGVLVALVGVAIVTRAGQLKECKMGIEVEYFNLKKGLLLALMYGIFSAGMSFAINAAVPMHRIATESGNDPLYAALPSYVVIMAGGAIINLGYCMIRMFKSHYISVKKRFLPPEIADCNQCSFVCPWRYYVVPTVLLLRLGPCQYSCSI